MRKSLLWVPSIILSVWLSFSMGLGVGCSSNPTGEGNTQESAATTDSGTTDKSAQPEAQQEASPEKPIATVDPVKEGYQAICPGASGCVSNQGALKVGASAVKITPQQYEVARWSYFQEEGFCPPPTPDSAYGVKRCGVLHDDAIEDRADCGLDGLCPRDNIRTRLSCKAPNKCPEGLTCNSSDNRCTIPYPGPDKDGSEGDGLPDYFLDCGNDRICPCLDPNDKPAYYGANQTCLKGHKPNPAYKGPDPDGSEGDKVFQAMWMGGFAGNHPMQGFHDDTWSRAFVVETGDTTVAIVSVDTVGLFFDDIDKARKQIKQKLPPGSVDYILVSSTHTHEGPDTMGQWGPRKNGLPAGSGRNQPYQTWMLDRIAESIIQAYNNRKPATLRVGRTRTGAAGLVRDTRYPFIFDDTLLVLQAKDSSGETIATIVNWGNHPEVLSDINNYNSSDYCHYVREALEKGLDGKEIKVKPQGGVAIFVQGALGALMAPLGLTTPDRNGDDIKGSTWERAQALGHRVAGFAQKALDASQPVTNADVSLWAKPVRVRVDNRAFHVAFTIGLLERQGVGYDPDLPIKEGNIPKIMSEVAMIRVGPVTFYSMPGELDPQILVGGYDGSYSHGNPLIDDTKFPELRPKMEKNAPKGPYLKEQIPGQYKFMVGLGNDALGYLLAPWNFTLSKENPYFEQAKGDYYEETNSLGPYTIPTLLEAYKDILQRAKTSAPPSPTP
ncbi:MAG: hypothetical protein EP343_20030 [Deltaproteobacteria bacterium]|nr:MAG: hypothetical protein EP343_20030 [Deltaproteobacteria bacterium]